MERGAYALGVGLVEMRADSLSGPQLRLGTEATRLDVSGKKVRNRAVPCYFVACFTADPPNTWKSCFEARAESDRQDARWCYFVPACGD